MRVAVLGVGLIGGSIGLAAKRRLGAEVAGFDPDAEILERALEREALDSARRVGRRGGARAPTSSSARRRSARCRRSSREALEASGAEDAVVTDVGSTKRELVAELGAGAGGERFIGGHPLAGAETAGVENARARPLRGRALVPDPDRATRAASTTTACSGRSPTSAPARRRSTPRPTTA